MLKIPSEYTADCAHPGKITTVPYGEKAFLLYTPVRPASHILYLIHGGGGDERTFFRPSFVHMVDHMIDKGQLEPLYIVTPCFYDPEQTDKSPGTSGKAVLKFQKELREQIVPLAEKEIGRHFDCTQRAISGFSMGGMTTWYAFMGSLDLFYWFMPMSGDCWALGEKGGGDKPEETAEAIVDAVKQQKAPDFRLYAITGSKDIAYPNLDPQMQALKRYSDIFEGKLRYDVLDGGVHDYETIFRYLYNALPVIFH